MLASTLNVEKLKIEYGNWLNCLTHPILLWLNLAMRGYNLRLGVSGPGMAVARQGDDV